MNRPRSLHTREPLMTGAEFWMSSTVWFMTVLALIVLDNPSDPRLAAGVGLGMYVLAVLVLGGYGYVRQRQK